MENLTEREILERARALKNKYQKEWYDKNLRKRTEHQKNYWVKKVFEEKKRV